MFLLFKKEILQTLGFVEEDWIVDRDIDPENNSCLITNLVIFINF